MSACKNACPEETSSLHFRSTGSMPTHDSNVIPGTSSNTGCFSIFCFFSVASSPLSFLCHILSVSYETSRVNEFICIFNQQHQCQQTTSMKCFAFPACLQSCSLFVFFFHSFLFHPYATSLIQKSM